MSLGGASGTPDDAATAAEQHSSRFRIFVDTQLALDAPSKRWGAHKNMASASNGELLFAVLSSSGVDVEDREGDGPGHKHGSKIETQKQTETETGEASGNWLAGVGHRDAPSVSTIAAPAADSIAGTSAFTLTASQTPHKTSAVGGDDGGNHCSAVVPGDHTQHGHQDELHRHVNPYSPHRSRGNSGMMDNLHLMPSLEVDLPADGRPVKV
jgi:hypothetical protein